MNLGIMPHEPLGWRIVTDGRTLRALARAGWLVLPPEHGHRVRTAIGTGVCKYVKEGPKHVEKCPSWASVFEHKGREYRLQYFDGCWKPFLTRFDKGVTP